MKQSTVAFVIAGIFVFLLLFVFLACRQNDATANYYAQKHAWYDSLRVGHVFRQAYNSALVEDSEFQKYRVYDSRHGTLNYIYITVKKSRIVAVWAGRY